MIEIWLGNPGCLHKDTLINVNRAGRGKEYKIRYIYDMLKRDYKKGWNKDIDTYVRSYDGKSIRLNRLKDIIHSGKKLCRRINLDNDNFLIATDDHEIMTKEGFKTVSSLCINDEVMVDNLYPASNKKRSFKVRYGHTKAPNHRYKDHHGNVSAHRLCYEAYKNGMSIPEYFDVLWNDPVKSKDMFMVDTSKYVVHHIDENPFNNSKDNLELMTHDEHKRHHGDFTHFNQGVVGYSSVVSIENVGMHDTYDIVCEDPHRNFVANGMVVHNSGKTASCVRDLAVNDDGRTTFSNITTKKIKNNVKITGQMIVKKEIVSYKKNGEPNVKLSLNKDFWIDARTKYKALNVVIDEAHTLMDPRRSMSKVNKIMGDWMALIRRVIGSSDAGYGKLVLISQLQRRIDVIAREMSTHIRYHRCHYVKVCQKCSRRYPEHNDYPEKRTSCVCGSPRLRQQNHIIEVWHFVNIDMYIKWKEFGERTYHKHYLIKDIEDYFSLYDTYQWEDLVSELYD